MAPEMTAKEAIASLGRAAECLSDWQLAYGKCEETVVLSASELAQFSNSMFRLNRIAQMMPRTHDDQTGMDRPDIQGSEQREKPKAAERAIEAQPARGGKRRPDKGFDFLIFETIEQLKAAGKLASKDRILQVLKTYDPRTNEKAFMPKLDTWKKEPKSWVDWEPMNTSKIWMTDRGLVHRKKILEEASEKRDRIETAIQEHVNGSYRFPSF